MTNRKLLIGVSLGILIAIIGPVMLVQNTESIKIRWYTWKLDSEDATTRKNAFEWLKTLAQKNLEDKRLKAFFKHPESRRQVEAKKDPPALVSSAKNGDLVELKILLDQGANVNAKDSFGMTPLHWAALIGKVKVAWTLIDRGEEVNTRNKIGRTPLEYAQNKAIKNLLRKHGAKTGDELEAEAKAKKNDK